MVWIRYGRRQKNTWLSTGWSLAIRMNCQTARLASRWAVGPTVIAVPQALVSVTASSHSVSYQAFISEGTIGLKVKT